MVGGEEELQLQYVLYGTVRGAFGRKYVVQYLRASYMYSTYITHICIFYL